MTVLGAIIGGGGSRRFGSDKALAVVDGITLIEHVYAALRPQVDDIVVCGRPWRTLHSLSDVPCAGQGPLGGLNAALAFGRERGFGWVLSAPVDTLPIPDRLFDILGPGPGCLKDQPLVGIWPTKLSDLLSDHIAAGNRSVRSWLERSKSREVALPGSRFVNVNYPSDILLAQL